MRLTAAAVLALGLATAVALDGARGAEPQAGDPRTAIHAIENTPDPSRADIELLTSYAKGAGPGPEPADVDLRRQALRALGRFERSELIPVLTRFLDDPRLRPEAELGLLLTLRAHAAGADPLIDETVARLLDGSAAPAIVGHLPYRRVELFARAEARLRQQLLDQGGPRSAAAYGLETLARRNRRLGSLGDETIAALARAASWQLPAMQRPRDTGLALNAVAALVSAGAMTAERVEAALADQSPAVRHHAGLVLASAAPLDPARRTALTELSLRDSDPLVRYEGVKAWSRHAAAVSGCGPLEKAARDTSLHVALAAIDALGERCQDEKAVTGRLMPDPGNRETGGSWHRTAHTLVAVARRDPSVGTQALSSSLRHPVWQVRAYAARAASFLKDVEALKLLSTDTDDNVRHAALPLLRALDQPASDPFFLTALSRGDYQLLYMVATTLKGAPRGQPLRLALTEALRRVTSERKDTSRDTRLALMARIEEQGGDTSVFDPLLEDFDPAVASEAAAALGRITGRPHRAVPTPLSRPAPPAAGELRDGIVARVEIDDGRSFDITFDTRTAPLAVARFVRLIRAGYYDGTTFHRVVPDFVIQGGSPGANEYAGDSLFMRDEIGMGTHAAGTVGISTRGRHTGDAQIFVNLADNRRLDFDYTIVGRVTRGFESVREIQEGARMVRVRLAGR